MLIMGLQEGLPIHKNQRRRIMKYRNVFFVICSFVLFLGITSFAYMQSNSKQKLELMISSSKQSYKLGEVISFSF